MLTTISTSLNRYSVLDRLVERKLIGSYEGFRQHELTHAVSASVSFGQEEGFTVRVPFRFQDKYYILEPTSQRDANEPVTFTGIPLTIAGKELYSVVLDESVSPEHLKRRRARAAERYIQALSAQLALQNLMLTENEIGEDMPIITPKDELARKIQNNPGMRNFFERHNIR